MFKNFIKVAYRNILRSRGFSIINISGLAIGMACAMLILLWVQHELTYDNFYVNKDRLYQAWNNDRGNNGIDSWNVTPKALGPGLKNEYPEIEQSTRVNWDQTILFTVGEKKLNIKGTMVDPDFLTMFQFPFEKGDMKTALDEPGNIVITRKLATTLFGSEDAIGKTILIDNKSNFKVSGILQDLPNNTQFDFDYLLPWSYMKVINQDDSSWDSNSTRNYVMVKPNTNIDALNAKIKGIIIKHTSPQTTTQSFLYPVSKLWLYSEFKNGVPDGGRISSVRIFFLIASFILLIACINFMNMSTARSEKRAKEVGIRKVVGAEKKSLIAQFLGESIMLAVVAGALAIVLLQLALPAFNDLTQQHLVIAYGDIHFWLYFIGFIFLTGIIAGSYPAFFLSSFRPVSVLKGTFKKAHALVTPRKILVVLQFSFAMVMIVCTLVIEKQIIYARERETGYSKEHITYTFFSGDLYKNYKLLKNDLLQQGIAVSVTKTSAPLTEGWSNGGMDWQGKNPNDRTSFNRYFVDGDIIKTAGLHLIEGRDMDLDTYPTDSTAVILNEAAVKAIGFKNPIGKTVSFNGYDWHIIGVVKDFILQSPYDNIQPMTIAGVKVDWFNMIHVRLNPDRSTARSISDMEKVFHQYNPKYPFEYHFIDQEYARKFADEQTMGILSALFTGLTIFISCLGLFGLAAYMAENRIKEIGVRKVLGASITGIATLLSKDFIKLVLLAILISTPIAWALMTRWLMTYNYRITLEWWLFAAAGILIVAIALCTVSFQAIKAAMLNPAKSLRSE